MKPTRILICDDDDIDRNIMRILLKRMKNVEADFAANGAEGLELFVTNNNYDLIITDLHMPELSGDELIEVVREDFDSEVPIIVTTGSYFGDEKKLYNELDIDEVLAKPYKPEELRNMIKSLTNYQKQLVA